MADDLPWPFRITGHLVEVVRALLAHQGWLSCQDVALPGGLKRMATHNWLSRLVIVGYADKQENGNQFNQFRYRLTKQGQQFAEHVRREADAGRLRLIPVSTAKQTQLRAEQQAMAIRLYEQHLPLIHISRQIGRSSSLTYRLLCEAGVDMRQPRPRPSLANSPQQLAETDVAAYNAGGETVRSMAARLGLSYGKTYRLLSGDARVRMRRQGKAP